MLRKSVSVAVILAMCLSIFACGCGGGKSSSSGTKKNLGDVEVYSFYEPHFDDENHATGIAAKKYKELYGGEVKVTVLPYANYASTLTNMIAAGTQPDMVSVYWGDMPNWGINILQPVDKYMDITKLNHQKLVEAYSFNDKHYTMAVTQVQTKLLWYNKAIFERYGIEKTPYDLWKEGNWTWDVFRDLAKQLTQDNDGDGVTDMYGFISNDPQCFHYSNSAPFIEVNKDQVSLVWDSNASIHAFEMWRDIRTVDKSMNLDGEAIHSGAFENEQVAMAHGTFEFPFFRSAGMDIADIGAAPMPTGPDFDGTYYATTNFFGLVRGAKNVEGAVALAELIDEADKSFEMGFDLGNTDATDLLTDEQKEVVEYVTKNVNLAMDRGWGNFIESFMVAYGETSNNKNITTVLDSQQQVAMAEINDTVERLKKAIE